MIQALYQQINKYIKYIGGLLVTLIGIIGLLLGLVSFMPTYVLYAQLYYTKTFYPWIRITYLQTALPFLICSLLIVGGYIFIHIGIELIKKQIPIKN